jgi:hypothetical protein
VREGVGHALTQETREVLGDLVIALDTYERHEAEQHPTCACSPVAMSEGPTDA